jgi:P-type Ca2+ transporter type 2C
MSWPVRLSQEGRTARGRTSGVTLALQFAGLYLPFLQELLHTDPLTGLDLAVVFLAATLGYAAIRLDRVLFRRKRGGSG